MSEFTDAEAATTKIFYLPLLHHYIAKAIIQGNTKEACSIANKMNEKGRNVSGYGVSINPNHPIYVLLATAAATDKLSVGDTHEILKAIVGNGNIKYTFDKSHLQHVAQYMAKTGDFEFGEQILQLSDKNITTNLSAEIAIANNDKSLLKEVVNDLSSFIVEAIESGNKEIARYLARNMKAEYGKNIAEKVIAEIVEEFAKTKNDKKSENTLIKIIQDGNYKDILSNAAVIAVKGGNFYFAANLIKAEDNPLDIPILGNALLSVIKFNETSDFVGLSSAVSAFVKESSWRKRENEKEIINKIYVAAYDLVLKSEAETETEGTRLNAGVAILSNLTFLGFGKSPSTANDGKVIKKLKEVYVEECKANDIAHESSLGFLKPYRVPVPFDAYRRIISATKGL